MAIDKTVATPQGSGNDLQHHVLWRVLINKKGSSLNIRLASYKDASNYNNNDQPDPYGPRYEIDFSNLPTPVKQAGLAFLASVEDAMIANISEFSEGTRVNDNGTPIN